MKKNRGGFTIIELLVATAVFAGVLLLAIVGFTQIGRLFYKGVAVSQTRQTASQVMDAVTSDIRLSSGEIDATYLCNPQCGGATGAQSLSAYCIGNHLYIPNLKYLLDLSTNDFSNNFGMIQSQTGGTCSGSGTGGAFTHSDLVKPVEMLGDNMRISHFQITHPNGTEYSVDLTVAYGKDNVFNDSQADQPTCKGIATGSQFCAVIRLTGTASFRPSLNP